MTLIVYFINTRYIVCSVQSAFNGSIVLVLVKMALLRIYQ